MAIPKIMGIEQEYAILVQGDPDFDPVSASFQLVGGYRGRERILWDYGHEDPLRDARGFVHDGETPNLTAEENLAVNNVLANGARFYVDHAHPEFSTAECTNPRDLVAMDRAGQLIVEASRRAANRILGRGRQIVLYKNNTDHKGNSYGCHENYLVDSAAYDRFFRPQPARPEQVVQHLVPFLVSRQCFCGAGKAGSENGTDWADYQISQRADFFETLIDGRTMHNRPIVNTRDEPHADRTRYRRLHIIVGDANLSETCTFLKAGTTALVLRMMEDRFLHRDLSLEDPVRDIVAISHDPTLTCRVPLVDGRKLTALELQREYLEAARAYVERAERDGQGAAYDREVIDEWSAVLDGLEEDIDSMRDRIDWVTKLWLIRRQMRRKRLDWRSPRVQQLDILYHDIRPDRGLFPILEGEGTVRRILADGRRAEHFVNHPPDDTRAYFRGRVLSKFGDRIASVSWDHLIFRCTPRNKAIALADPLKGTKERVGELLDRCDTVEELLAAVTG